MPPRTVTILFSSDINNTKENLILKLISCQGITYVSSTVVEYFEKSSIIVILIRDESEAYSVKKYIDDFTDAFPNETRPKILMVLLEGKIQHDDTIRRIYEHGWTNKFLDVSLVKIGHSSSCVVQAYNPFESRVGEKNLNEKSIELFPDKLINVHRKKITMGAIPTDPLVKIVRNSVGEVMSLDSADTDKTILAFESMNFNIEYVILNETVGYFKGLLMFVDELRTNELNLMAFSRGFSSAFDNVTHVYSDVSCYSVAAAVPYWIKTKVRLPWQTLTYLFLIPSFIGFITWMLKLVNALNDSVRIFNIFGSLFGVSIGMKPTKITEMIVLSTIYFVSIVFPSDFYSQFINEKLVKGSVDLNTFKSIDDSGLDVFCLTAYSQTLLEINDTWAKNIHQRLTPTYDQSECVADLMTGNPRVCISAYEYLLKMIESLGTSETYKVHFARQNLACLPRSYLLERASPYAEKFHEKLRYIHESGIDGFFNKIQSYKSFGKSYRTMNFTSNQFQVQLSFFIIIGSSIAIVVFLYELLSEIVSKKIVNKGVDIKM
ncbi:hypothetical protein TKK_0011327 [Trichogramma kaykai]